jgi:hypothetical protein
VSLFDLIYDWLIHAVPTWLWWVLITPLMLFVVALLIENRWPGLLFG